MNARWLIIAIALTIFLVFLPFAHIITYPFLIFSTFIHETAHALAAVLTGGEVESLIVRMDGSGITYTRGGIRFLVSSAGYVGTTLFGALLLLLSRTERTVRPVLIGGALFVLMITAFFVGHTNNLIVLGLIGAIATLFGFSARRISSPSIKRNQLVGGAFALLVILIGYLFWTKSLFSWSAGLLIASALIGVARFAPVHVAHFFLTFLAVQCCLNALNAIKNLYFVSLQSSCGNDAATMASLTGLPAWIWAVLWAVLSVFILTISAAFYARNRLKTSPFPA
jgi:hypothetical protein